MNKKHYWEKGIDEGKFISRWKGFHTMLIGGSYSESFDIGESKFYQCIGEYGSGDAVWWVKSEIDKLSEAELMELEMICAYKVYAKDFVTFELVDKLADFFDCNSRNIYRTGDKAILDLCINLSGYSDRIIKESEGDCSEEVVRISNKGYFDMFKGKTFEEFKASYNKGEHNEK